MPLSLSRNRQCLGASGDRPGLARGRGDRGIDLRPGIRDCRAGRAITCYTAGRGDGVIPRQRILNIRPEANSVATIDSEAATVLKFIPESGTTASRLAADTRIDMDHVQEAIGRLLSLGLIQVSGEVVSITSFAHKAETSSTSSDQRRR